jgi:manganese/iron transport system substrate-binding protein
MTPERFKLVVESIKAAGVRAVFVETSVNPKLVREVARAAGVKVGGELYSDSMGPPGSAGETYIGMMRENTITIAEALK